MINKGMKRYLWYVEDTGQTIELNSKPSPGSEDRAHFIRMIDEESGDDFLELKMKIFFRGEIKG